MKKKLLAILLCAALSLSLLAACNNEETAPIEEPSPPVVPDAPTPEPPPAGPAEIDSNLPAPVYHFTFEEDNEGIVAVVRDDNPPHSLPNGIAEDGSIPLLFTNGPVGNALYIDGTHGVRLPVQPLNTNTYTISFWVNADRLSTFGPTLQVGNIAGNEDEGGVVTWINFTQTDWNEKHFPTAWNRNSEKGFWPWINVLSDSESITGRREWAMFTLVATGVEYMFEEIQPRIAAKLYINGELKISADASNLSYHGLDPDLLNDYGTFDCLFGLNYWDELYKGYVDDLYFFTDALTDGQVAYLWSLGDPTVETQVPEFEPEPVAQVVTTIDGSALYTLGNPDTEVLGWWSEHTDAYELKNGGTLTLKFNNYGRNFNNWDNYVFAIAGQAYSRDAGYPPHEADGYVEYGVVRGDAFHWGGGFEDVVYEYDWNWDDFQSIMSNAQVTLVFSRDGGNIFVDGTVLDMATGTEYNYDITITSTAAAGDPTFVFLTGEKMYLELLAVE